MNDYVRFALDAGLVDLTLPQLTPGDCLGTLLMPQPDSACSPQLQKAAHVIASIKFHGRKPE